MVPGWLREEVERATGPDGTMAPGDLALYARALMPSPGFGIPDPQQDATFDWVVKPLDGYLQGVIYTDGSLPLARSATAAVGAMSAAWTSTMVRISARVKDGVF